MRQIGWIVVQLVVQVRRPLGTASNRSLLGSPPFLLPSRVCQLRGNCVLIYNAAKRRERPVDIGLVGQIDDLRDDVGAHLAIIASPIGFTDGARGRAPQVSVALLTVTADLLSMLDKLEIPWLHGCQNDLSEVGRGYIDWRQPSMEGQTILESCQYCDVLHVLCPDCGSVTLAT